MSHFLYLIDGPSGSGKSKLQGFVKRHLPSLAVVYKFTSRKPEDKGAAGAVDDQKLITDEEFDRFQLNPNFKSYKLSGYRYGFYLAEIEQKISSSDVFVIVRSLDTIRDLKTSAASNVGFQVAAVYIRSPEQERKRYLAAHGFTDDEIARRLRRDDGSYSKERERNTLYDEVIDNRGSVEDLFDAFIQVVRRYSNSIQPGA